MMVLFPQEAIDYLADVAGVRINPAVKLPKATITVDKWREEGPIFGPSGALIVPHDGEEESVVRRNRDFSTKSI